MADFPLQIQLCDGKALVHLALQLFSLHRHLHVSAPFGISGVLLEGFFKGSHVVVQHLGASVPGVLHTDILKMLQFLLCCQTLHLLSMVLQF